LYINQGELANNIYPLLCEPYVSTDVRTSLGMKRDWIICSCSMFKLWQACEKAVNEGMLEDIDALLGMGILMYEKQTADVSVLIFFRVYYFFYC
jgi:hypothetical protein